MIEGLVRRFLAEIPSAKIPCVVATGGYVSLIASAITVFDHIDETLTLDGLRMLANHH
jgi:pantothenate kinase type III